MQITQKFLTKNDCYNAHESIIVKGLMLHSIGTPQPKADVLIRSWNKPNYKVCVHAFIDGDTGNVYQTLPWTYRAWHGGGKANNTHIGVEMCEPSNIKYKKNSSTIESCTDKAAAREIVKRTYESAVQLFAKLCVEYNLDPLANGVIISHREGAERGIASNHGDPEHIWIQLGLPYTMDTFRADVKKAINANTQPTTDGVMYKVQLGAYKVKDNAVKLKDKLKAAGFDAYVTVIDGYYKVQVGAYSVKTNAVNMLARLKNAGYSNAFIATIEVKEEIQPDITVGDRVKVLKAVDYNGKKFATFYAIYDVIQVSGDKVVIGIGKTVTAAVNKKNLQEV